MRDLTGKSARLTGVDFDREAVNTVRDEAAEAEEEKLREETAKLAEADVAKKVAEEAENEAKVQAALASHQPTDQVAPETDKPGK
jgi:preprotein translocase subunit SecF